MGYLDVRLGLLVLLALVGIASLPYTTARVRRRFREAHGREPRVGEETSMRSWMAAPDPALEEACDQLRSDPSERLMRWLARFGLLSHELPEPDRSRAPSVTRE